MCDFFDSLKNKVLFDELEITIFSDHDSRIKSDDKGSSVIFFNKNKNSSTFKIIPEVSISNEVFRKIFYAKNN